MVAARTRDRVRLLIGGLVQGVGFRPHAYRLAESMEVAGWVANDPRGVLIEAEGAPRRLERFLDRLVRERPAHCEIQTLERERIAPVGETRFEIRASEAGADPIAPLPPDLAMCGARPLYLSAALIIEEGLPVDRLSQIARSMRDAADDAGVSLVTGDTKVVDRGKGDQLFITTSGVGLIQAGVIIDPRRAAPGDRILVSGPIGRHGIAVLSVREGLAFESPVESDTAPLAELVGVMLAASREIHVLRDPTRGGLATALNEIAGASGTGMALSEPHIPVDEAVRGACELLGLDPLYVANEGRLLAVVPPEAAEAVLAAMRAHPSGREAAMIGEVVADHPGLVVMRSRIGGERVIDLLSGEQLPRIC